jgi:putative hemolysin
MLGKIFIILGLIFINGIFVMAEIAIVASRRSRLEELLKKGQKNARLVMDLSEKPNKFLSTIQVGITSIAIMTGILGSTSIAMALASTFSRWGIPVPYDYDLAIIAVVLIITFVSIVLGELLPKRIGLTNPEAISMALVKPVMALAWISAPFVWLLSVCTEFLIRIFRIRKKTELQVTENEIKALLEEGTETGSIQEIEQDIVERVFHLGDQRIGALMTNRNDIVWLNTEDPDEVNHAKMSEDTHSVYPVCDKELDNILGIVQTKDLLVANLKSPGFDLKSHIRPVNLIPSDQKAYQVLEKFKQTKIHCAFVVDEFGSIEGMVTLNDILDGLVGDITETDEPEIVQRSADSWLIDGRLAFFEFIHEFEIEDYDASEASFHSIGGFVIHQMGTIPRTGDIFEWHGYRFEIVDMDGNRVDKILLTKT